MKKWLSVALICNLLIMGISSIGSNGDYVKAEENDNQEKVESITDLDQYENNDLIVVYKDNTMTEKKLTTQTVKIGDLSEEDTAETLTDNSVVVKLDNKEDLKEAIDTYSNNSSVAYVQPNYVYHTLTDVSITDTDYAKQWGMNNNGSFEYQEEVYSYTGTSRTGSGYTWDKTQIRAKQDIDVNAPEAWSRGVGDNQEVIVAIVDTGIKYDHTELMDSMWVNPNEYPGDGIDNDNNGYIDDIHGWNFYAASSGSSFGGVWPIWGGGSSSSTDSNGNNTYYNANSETEDAHATHCAGVVAAKADGTGVVGIAHQQNVKIMIIKALGGEDGSGTTESVVKGIEYAQNNGAAICNLSLGGDKDDATLREVIQNSDMLFCIAAGNGYDKTNYQGWDMDAASAVKEYPACYDFDNIITVANVQCDGELHYSSNYGENSVDIAAPGAAIYSTSTVNEEYEYMTGTSMAAPMVSGIAALLYSYDKNLSTDKNLSAQKVKDIILNSAKEDSSLKGKVACGGIVDAEAALESISSTMETPTALVTTTPTSSIATASPVVSGSVTPAVTSIPEKTETPVVSETPKVTQTPIVQTTPTAKPSIAPTILPVKTLAPETTVPVITIVPSSVPTETPLATETPSLGTATDTSVENAKIILKTNKKAKLIVYYLPEDATVTWKSANTAIATVTQEGVITAKAAGKTTISAILSTGTKLSCSIIVRPVTPSSVKAAQVHKKLKVRVRWGKLTGISGYEVLRATSKDGKYKVVKDVTKSGVIYYYDKNVTTKIYYYKVRAYKKLSDGSKIYSTLSSAYKVKVKKY